MKCARIGFDNAHMFDRVMLDERICSMFLERVLGFQVNSIVYKNAEQALKPSLDSRGVRLDVFVKSADKAIDIELQADPRGYLGKRFRYYQSAIDAALLDEGDDYWKLLESYVIFICKFDPFGRGLPLYTMTMACREDPSVDADCGMRWLTLNCASYAAAPSDSMRHLLEYIQVGAVDHSDNLVSAIDSAVTKANEDRKWVDEVFSVSTIEEDIRREARFREWQARNEGEAKGRAEGEARYSALVDRLLSLKRLDDLKRATKDPSFRKSLYAEFGI